MQEALTRILNGRFLFSLQDPRPFPCYLTALFPSGNPKTESHFLASPAYWVFLGSSSSMPPALVLSSISSVHILSEEHRWPITVYLITILDSCTGFHGACRPLGQSSPCPTARLRAKPCIVCGVHYLHPSLNSDIIHHTYHIFEPLYILVFKKSISPNPKFEYFRKQ